MSLGVGIRKLRKEKKITIKDFARLIGVSTGSLGNIERNGAIPRKNTFKGICKVLDCSPSMIYLHSIENTEVTGLDSVRANFAVLTLKHFLKK